MDAPGPEPTTAELSLAGIAADTVSGSLVAVISLAYCLSFAALMFSGPLTGCLASGVGPTLISAGLGSLILAVFSSSRFSIGGPDTATVAVLSALAAATAAASATLPADRTCNQSLVALVTTTVATGGVLLAMGTLRVGRWIRYIPYPVIGGFLAASGYLLSAGAFKVITGKSLGMDGLTLSRLDLLHLATAAVVSLVIFLARRRFRSPLALPGALAMSVALFHVALPVLGVSVPEARAAGWLLPSVTGDGLMMPWRPAVWHAVDWSSLIRGTGAAAAAAGVTAVAVLLNSTGLEVARKTSLDLDRELRVHGVANIASGLAGGIIVNLALNRTLLNASAGARSRLSGIVASLLCLAVVPLGAEPIAFVPAPVLGGLLLLLGLSLAWEWVVRAPTRLGGSDYLLVLAILVLIVVRGYLEGIALGVVISCLIFAARYSRIDVVKRDLTRREFASAVERSPDDSAYLRERGDRIILLWIQGYLFFGSANRLLETVKVRIAGGARNRRFVIFDFAAVAGLDSSAVFSFVKLIDFAAINGVTLVFSGLTPALDAALRRQGLLADGPAIDCVDIDSAIEWAEERLLEERPAVPPPSQAFLDWLDHELGAVGASGRLLPYLDIVDLDDGQVLFRQGEAADALYLIERGRLSVVLTVPHDSPLRLRSTVGCTVIGEMGVYRHVERFASVTAEGPSRTRRLSRDGLERLQREDPSTACAFHAMIVRILADRLGFANIEAAALRR
jgi:SulP family sulfate permease